MGNSQWYKQTLRKTLVISLWWKIYIIYADIPCKQGDFYQFHLFSTVSRTGGKNWLLPGLAMSMSETSSREYPSSLPGGVVSKFWGRNANTCHWLMILVHSYSPLYNSNKLVNRHIYIIHNIICIRIYIYMYNICIYNIYIYIYIIIKWQFSETSRYICQTSAAKGPWEPGTVTEQNFGIFGTK